MIVKWTEDRIKVIPRTDGQGCVILAPGYNEVEDATWQYARSRVLKQIADGMLVEEWTKIAPEQVKDYPITEKDGKNDMAPAKLADINRPRVITEVVKTTYHIPTLNRWLEKELRPDVRIALMKQLTDVDRNNVMEHKAALAKTLDTIR